MSDDTTKERHQFTDKLIALQDDLRPSVCTIVRVTSESGGSSAAGQRWEIHAGVPYELTPCSATATWRLYRTRIHTAFTVLTTPHTTAVRSLPHSKCNTLYNYAAPHLVKKFPAFYGTRRSITIVHINDSRPRTNVTGLPPQISPIIHAIYCKTVRNPKTNATGTCRSSSNKLGNACNNSACCHPRCND